MELRTEAVDRVLEALSPALSAELDRVIEENRQALELEFQNRLQIAIQNAEENTRLITDVERQQAVGQAIEETRQSVRTELTAELQTEFERRLAETRESVHQQVTDDLQGDFDRRFQEVTAQAALDRGAAEKAQTEWNDERVHLQQQIDQWRVFAESPGQLADSTSQPEILARWLNFAQPFAGSVALYTIKADGLSLWKSLGETAFPRLISQATMDPESYFRPVVVRGKTVAAVAASQPFRADALDFLIKNLERAIELFGFRLRNR